MVFITDFGQIPTVWPLTQSQDLTYVITIQGWYDLLLYNVVLNRFRHENDFSFELVARATEDFLMQVYGDMFVMGICTEYGTPFSSCLANISLKLDGLR